MRNVVWFAAMTMSYMSKIYNNIPSIRIPTVDPKTNEPISLMMPIIGFGTYKFQKGTGEVSQAIKDACRVGYRSIDTAFIYGGEQTEKEVGEALSDIFSSDSSISRSDIFLTSKQWRAYHGYEQTMLCLSKSLSRLQTCYLDLYLLHWPGCAYNTMSRRKDVMNSSPDGPFVYAKEGHEVNSIQALRSETWRAMEDALFEGKVRAIGVSNFEIQHLEALKKTARVWPPAVNQIELHPYNTKRDLVDYCRKEGIRVQAYASLGGQDSGKKTWNALGGKLLNRIEVIQIASKYGRSAAQVLLRWATQQGIVVIPKSTNIDHMKLNLAAVLDESWLNKDGNTLGLDKTDIEILSDLDQSFTEDGSINEKSRLCWLRDPLKMLDFD